MTLTPFAETDKPGELFMNPTCRFPCWWSITPGTTTWEDAESLFKYLNLPVRTKTQGNYSTHEVVLGSRESVNNIHIMAFDQGGIVDYLAISGFLPAADFRRRYASYEPKRILAEYGTPQRAYIFADLLGETSYTLILFYDDQGFMISYGGHVDHVTKNGIVICPDFARGSITGGGFSLISPQSNEHIEDFPDEELQAGFATIKPYLRTVQDATGLTIDEFRDLFVGRSPTHCFTITKQ